MKEAWERIGKEHPYFTKCIYEYKIINDIEHPHAIHFQYDGNNTRIHIMKKMN